MARLGSNTSRPPEILAFATRPSGDAAVVNGEVRTGSLQDLVEEHDPDLLIVEESLELPEWSFKGPLGIRDVLVLGNEAAENPLTAARSIYNEVAAELPGIIALRRLIPEPLQHHGDHPARTVSRTLQQRLGRDLPQHPKRDGIKGPRPYFREAGLYSQVFEVDFSAFYPSIIVNEKITPRWDTTGEYQKLAAELIGLRQKHPAGLATALIKQVAVSMSGFLNAGAPGSDPDCLIQVYEHGTRLLATLSNVVEQAGGAILWHQTDGMLVEGLLGRHTIDGALRAALPNYPVTVDGPLDVLILDTQNRVHRGAGGTRWKGRWSKAVRKLPGAEDLLGHILTWDFVTAAQVWRNVRDRQSWRRHLGRLWSALPLRDFVAVFGQGIAQALDREPLVLRDPIDQVRHRNEEGKRRRRLSVLGGAPCVAGVRGSLREGAHIDSEAIHKAIAELRIEGADRQSAGRTLVGDSREVFRNLEGLGVVTGSTPDPKVADSHWAPSAGDQYSPSCRHPSLQGLCARHLCYRQSVPPSYRDTGLEPDAYVERIRSEAEHLLHPPEVAGVRHAEVPCRAGKTHSVARRAHEAAAEGKKVWIVVPDHRAAHQVMVEIKARRPTKMLVVHQIGRSIASQPNDEVCWNTSAASCGACARSVLDARLDRRKGVYDQSKLETVARRFETKDKATCPRTLSYRLAPHADIRVFTTAAYIKLCADHLSESSEAGLPDLVLVDEADHLASGLHADSRRDLPLAAARTGRHHLYREGEASCAGTGCKDCHFQFPDLPGEDRASQPVFRKHLTTVDAVDSAASFLHEVINELLAFQRRPNCQDGSDVAATVALALEVVGGLLDLLDQVDGRSPRDQLRQLQGRQAAVGEAGWVWRETQAAWTWRLSTAHDYPAEIDKLCDDPRQPDRLRVALQLTRFVAKAALCSSELLLVPKAKTAPTQTWMPGCGLELSYVDEVRLARLLRPLKKRLSLLVSGTQGRPDIAQSRLGLGNAESEYRSADTGLHVGYTLFLVPPPGTSRSVDGAVDLRSDVKLGAWMDALAKERPELRVLVFAKTKKKAEVLYRHLSGRHQVRRLDVRDEVRPKKASRGLRIDVDYLRSSESRAVDRDYDLIVVHGTGLPNYSGLHTMSRWMEQEVGVALRPDELARDDASRTVAQALLRNARKTPAVGVLIGDHLPEGLPEYLRPRTAVVPRFGRAADPIQEFSDLVITALDGRRLPDTVARATMTGEAQALGLPKISTLAKIMRLRDDGGVSPTRLRERLGHEAAMRIYRHVPEGWRSRVDQINGTQTPV